MNCVEAFVCLLLFCFFTSITSNEGESCGNPNYESHVWNEEQHSKSNTEKCASQKNDISSENPDVVSLLIQNLQSSIGKAASDLADSSHYPASYFPEENEEFDFIVVGAGSAGSVVANRLTEISEWKVLLVEAGGNPTKTSEIPAFFGHLQKTEMDWQYESDLEENTCLGFVNNTCKWARGKVLGGSSTINLLVYVRGNEKDYNNWEAAGNKGWGYKDVLHYFKKSEDIRAEEVLNSPDVDEYHGRGGYLKVESWKNDEFRELTDAFINGYEELGYPVNPDCNGKRQTGFVRLQGNLDRGKRCSTAKAFLASIRDRDNLKVMKHSHATRLLIHKNNKTCYGVEFLNNEGKVSKLRAKKEVILSAGALNSPQILMLSGIGPKKLLDHLKIEVVKELPVGESLQDHPVLVNTFISVNVSSPTTQSPIDSMFQFLMKNSGSFAGPGTLIRAGHINTVNNTSKFADVQILQIGFHKGETEAVTGFLSLLGIKEEFHKDYLEINSNNYIMIMASSLIRPYSQGKVLLRSSNPKDYPKFITGYFSDPRDEETYLRVFEFLERLTQTKGMKAIGAKLHEVRIPACGEFPHGSREYRRCSLRYLSTTTHHQASTCRMGVPEDKSAVVDPFLRVLGVGGLRVADASVMPSIVSGNPNAAVIMIGEKASDVIKDEWLP